MLNQIGFYQLDNLISNRVPFLFINMAQSLAPLYHSVSRVHVQTHERLCSAENAWNEIISSGAPKSAAIVLLCENGLASSELCRKLEESSYTNVYVINGGYQQIVTERGQI